MTCPACRPLAEDEIRWLTERHAAALADMDAETTRLHLRVRTLEEDHYRTLRENLRLVRENRELREDNERLRRRAGPVERPVYLNRWQEL